MSGGPLPRMLKKCVPDFPDKDCSLITSCFIRRPSKSNGFDISSLEVEEILAGLVEEGFIHSILVACIAVCFLVYLPEHGVHMFSSMTNALIEAMTWYISSCIVSLSRVI
jgi:hypothetical protein